MGVPLQRGLGGRGEEIGIGMAGSGGSLAQRTRSINLLMTRFSSVLLTTTSVLVV